MKAENVKVVDADGKLRHAVKLMGTQDELEFAEKMREPMMASLERAKNLTDREKELTLSIAKKVYGKILASPNFPSDVCSEFGDYIRTRNWDMLVFFCSKPMLINIAKTL